MTRRWKIIREADGQYPWTPYASQNYPDEWEHYDFDDATRPGGNPIAGIDGGQFSTWREAMDSVWQAIQWEHENPNWFEELKQRHPEEFTKERRTR